MKLLQIITGILPISGVVHAHCDVPCGIYDPKAAQIAAETVLRMVVLINELPQDKATVADRNKFVRCVQTKEEHARKCKEEILILWTDYFKPEHHAANPGLTDKILAAAKLCSKNKQEVNIDAAKQLVAAVKGIADIFVKTKAAAQ